jgi:hypothetical protein
LVTQGQSRQTRLLLSPHEHLALSVSSPLLTSSMNAPKTGAAVDHLTAGHHSAGQVESVYTSTQLLSIPVSRHIRQCFLQLFTHRAVAPGHCLCQHTTKVACRGFAYLRRNMVISTWVQACVAHMQLHGQPTTPLTTSCNLEAKHARLQLKTQPPPALVCHTHHSRTHLTTLCT